MDALYPVINQIEVYADTAFYRSLDQSCDNPKVLVVR